jgi:hypothetical protein
MSRSSFPDAACARQWHDLLLAGDGTMPGVICQAFLDPLLAHLRRTFPHEDDHLLQEAVHSALLGYVKHPETYNPDRNPNLGRYLKMAVSGDARNLHSRERRRQRGRKVVELDTLGGNEPVAGGPLLRLIRDEETDQLSRAADAVGASSEDLVVMRLFLKGEKATVVYAAALGLTHLPVQEQEAEVKRAKDRVKKRWRRLKLHG